MTRAAFLARLAQTPRTWRLDSDGQIRCARGDCPIIAMRPGFFNSAWRQAGAELGLSLADAQAIVAAADDDVSADPELRQQLLVATGLAPQPENK